MELRYVFMSRILLLQSEIIGFLTEGSLPKCFKKGPLSWGVAAMDWSLAHYQQFVPRLCGTHLVVNCCFLSYQTGRRYFWRLFQSVSLYNNTFNFNWLKCNWKIPSFTLTIGAVYKTLKIFFSVMHSVIWCMHLLKMSFLLIFVFHK